MFHVRVSLSVAVLVITSGLCQAQGKQVVAVKTPHGGIQPQALVDARGTVHLLYFKGDAKGGDLYYVRRVADEAAFSTPLKVNSQAGSAVATGTIRGGHLALGKSGRAHVAWNASHFTHKASQLYYARLNDAGTAFEPQRNLMTQTDVLDGGGTVAADDQGNVYVAWHALQTDAAKGESNRKIWLAQSTDEGKTFAAERAVNPKATGACGCCGMRGFVDKSGTPYFIYRGASDKVTRDMYLLASTDKGKTFGVSLLDKWEIPSCPMSSEAFAEGPGGLGGLYTAWDTDGQVFFARIKAGSAAIEKPIAATGAGTARKHPALAVNKNGDVLLAWAVGTGWQRGGHLQWQVYDKTGRPTAEQGRLNNGIPVWGLPAAVAERDGRFTILH